MSKTLKQNRMNQILYISIGSVLALLILCIVLFYVFNRIGKNSNIELGENGNSYVPNVEQANSHIGKTISEVENENENETVAENLSVELGQNSDADNLDDFTLDLDTANNSNVGNSSELNNVNQENNTTDEKAQDNVSTAKNNNENNQENVETMQSNAEDEIPEPVFIKPVEGEIVKQYGKEKLLYSNTLKEWTTHLGIDIKANKTTIVKASSDGVVQSIKNDPRYGLTIIIEHPKGYTSVYSNLLSSEFVLTGEKVKSGQTIGTVGNSATFEIVDEPHLHFEITKDGENVDPEMCIK